MTTRHAPGYAGHVKTFNTFSKLERTHFENVERVKDFTILKKCTVRGVVLRMNDLSHVSMFMIFNKIPICDDVNKDC